MSYGVILLDGSGSPILANPRCHALLAVEEAQLQAEWPELRRRIEEKAGPDLWNEGRREVEIELPPKTGSGNDEPRAFHLEVMPIAMDDCTGHLIQVQDCEDRRRDLYDRLLASQMHSLSRLYRSTAHDLRAPLNAMVVNLELLGDAVEPGAQGDDLEARRQRYVRVLKEEMERLTRQLHAFLSQSAPVSRSRRREFDLVEMVEEMVLFVEPQANKQKTHLKVKVPSEPVKISGSQDQIRQTLLSLMVNALEAVGDRMGSDEPGEVEVGVHQVGEEVALWVADNGSGVDPRVAEDIFDLHFTTKEAGSGIGLHVARQVIEDHGGELTLAAPDAARAGSSDTGSLFKIRLPIRSAQASEESCY